MSWLPFWDSAVRNGQQEILRKKEKWDKNGIRIFYRKLAFAVFASLTPHRHPSPKNGLRHF